MRIMGKKRSKVTSTEHTHIEKKKTKLEKQEIEEVNLNILNDIEKSKQKSSKKFKTNNTEVLKSEDGLANTIKKQKLKNKARNLQITDTKLVGSDDEAKTKKKVKNSQSVETLTSNKKSKKIVFIDDEPKEVPVSSKTSTSSVEKNNKKFLNDDEAEVKEEDIDQFCDELDEEDNKQYEDWVKLIEDKLHSNKKQINT
ncbi:uncharacterized protein LOC126373937 isoform X2 [Pectinophora gossypiella]|uniref:uncharacterized protein LOC126373937 isoform X2 n=1 Tax=Pectinophora gossypiella TaxID=13191 RepID=UPI00214E3EE5|nr:uncharacterized protein LOC126373937 isoform X2 [Pectinophora gossypiella]